MSEETKQVVTAFFCAMFFIGMGGTLLVIGIKLLLDPKMWPK